MESNKLILDFMKQSVSWKSQNTAWNILLIVVCNTGSDNSPPQQTVCHKTWLPHQSHSSHRRFAFKHKHPYIYIPFFFKNESVIEGQSWAILLICYAAHSTGDGMEVDIWKERILYGATTCGARTLILAMHRFAKQSQPYWIRRRHSDVRRPNYINKTFLSKYLRTTTRVVVKCN